MILVIPSIKDFLQGIAKIKLLFYIRIHTLKSVRLMYCFFKLIVECFQEHTFFVIFISQVIHNTIHK